MPRRVQRPKVVNGPNGPRVRGVGEIKGPKEVRGVGSAQARRNQPSPAPDFSESTEEALEAYRDGDDSILLPYQPTPSINPPRPRTLAAGYNKDDQTMFVKFRDGALYSYDNVSQAEWRNFRRVKSPGKAINRTFNNKPYTRLEG